MGRATDCDSTYRSALIECKSLSFPLDWAWNLQRLTQMWRSSDQDIVHNLTENVVVVRLGSTANLPYI